MRKSAGFRLETSDLVNNCCSRTGCAGGSPRVRSVSKGEARANATPALTTTGWTTAPLTTTDFTGMLQTHQSSSVGHRGASAECWLLHSAAHSQLLFHGASCSDAAPACIGLGRAPPWEEACDPEEPHCRCHPHLWAFPGWPVVFWPLIAIAHREEMTRAFKAATLAIVLLTTAWSPAVLPVQATHTSVKTTRHSKAVVVFPMGVLAR